MVELLLTHGAYVNSAYTSIFQEGYKSLHLAAEKNSEEIIELLLSGMDADINTNGKYGTTSINIATERGYLNIVEHLLKHGAIYSTTRRGSTPPCFAIENVYEKIVKLLLEHGAKIDVDDKYDKTKLYFAVEKGNSIEHILKHHPHLNNKRSNSILNVEVKGWGIEYSKIIKNLLQYGFTVIPKDAKNLMYAAVKSRYLELVEELVKHDTDVNMLCNSISRKDYMPSHVASIKNRVEVAKLLISYSFIERQIIGL